MKHVFYLNVNQDREACTYENSTDSWPDSFSDSCTDLDLIEITGTDVDTESALFLEIDWDKTVAK